MWFLSLANRPVLLNQSLRDRISKGIDSKSKDDLRKKRCIEKSFRHTKMIPCERCSAGETECCTAEIGVQMLSKRVFLGLAKF